MIYLPTTISPVLLGNEERYHLVERLALPSGRTLCGLADQLDAGGAYIPPGVAALDDGYICDGCCRGLVLKSLAKPASGAERESAAGRAA